MGEALHMLLLMRRLGEAIRISDNLRLTVKEVKDDQVTFRLEDNLAQPLPHKPKKMEQEEV